MISVILPTYNRASRLTRAIRSIQHQTLQPQEIIVVDDGSTDDTAAVVSEMANDCSFPIELIHQANRGAAAARNRGICAARYPYLSFLDSDDWWLPHKLEKQFQAMSSHTQFLVSHTREIWYRRGVRVNQKKKHDPPHGDIFIPSLQMCMVGMSTVMVRRETFTRFGLFDERLPCCEDYELWLRIGAHEEFLLVPEQLICKDGGREDQLSYQYRLGMDVYRIEALCRLLANHSLATGQKQLVLEELSRKCTIYGNGCMKHGRPGEGNYYLSLPGQIAQSLETASQDG
ncbi:glycosyltransferase family 2 protein [Desulfogranum japonicum]|uniref:glycosyltransferase family 2 protein n=1 Tax=Desulfogranum japonicum TaxID=231447 RepID=UPI001E40BD8B|nr:glycosyltransferase family A protein [Desulfogranum japonicum]